MRKFLIVIIFLTMIGFIVYKDNTTVGTTYYDVLSHNLPEGFVGYKIIQISDLHDSMFGDNHSTIVKEVKKSAPDFIFITGDIIDGNRYELRRSLLLVEEIQHVAPIYYVTGNHEIATNDTIRIKDELRELGVHVLTDESEIITTSEGDQLAIGGIEDPLFSTLSDEDAVRKSVRHSFKQVPEDMFKILLAHRPEHFDVYAQNKIHITFSGHAHGGQFRLPWVGGLISPGEGFFPKLTSGVHEKNESQLVISRGLGNSLMPIRLFNQPEIIVVTLHNKEDK